MDRRAYKPFVLFLIATVVSTGCSPQQPFFYNEDGDLSHLLTEATSIDYPDVESTGTPDAFEAYQPPSLLNQEPGKPWDLSLVEAVHTALKNSKVIRSVGQVRQFRQVGQGVSTPPESLSINSDFASTIYDVGIVETGQNGVEQALSQFDAQWNTSLFWDRTDRPQNVTEEGQGTSIFARQLQRDNMNFSSELTKLSAQGTQWSFRNVTTYDSNNRPLRETVSEWLTSFEAEMRHPILRGGGAAVRRAPIMLARIQTDISLIDFMGNVRNLLSEVEKSYWELYFYYHNLDAAKTGRDSALLTWRQVNAKYQEGIEQGDAASVAQAQEQYFFFRGRAEEAKRDLLKAERQLRFLMGLAPSDGRIIRPSDKPTDALVKFEWEDIRDECLTRSGEIRRQKWRVKEQEIGLQAAKNNLLPQFDAVALYRWLGLGDQLWHSSNNRPEFPFAGSQAMGNLTGGDSQEWRMGFEMNVPLGFRSALAEVRNRNLQLARARAILEDLELEQAHSLSDAVQNLHASYKLMNTAAMQVLSASQQVEALQVQAETGSVTYEFLFDAQRRLADARVAYFQSLLQYNFSIVEVHYRKGSLLEYCGVDLQEGPWPQKAYFDAKIRARQRDASYYFNYGHTRPRVISRGGGSQSGIEAATEFETIIDEPVMEMNSDDSSIDVKPLPEPASSAGHIVPVQAVVAEEARQSGSEGSFQWGDLGLDE